MSYFSGVYGDSNVSSYSGAFNSYNRSTNRVNSTTATKAKITQTVKDLAQSHSKDLSIVKYYFQEGEITTALELQDKIYDDISDVLKSEYNFNVTDQEIESMLDQAYSTVNGESAQKTIEDNTSSSFMTGFMEGIPLIGNLLTNGVSKSEAMAELSGTDAPEREKTRETIGAAVGGTVSGAGVGAAIGTAVFIAGSAGKGAAAGAAVGPIGIVIGAGIGAAVGIGIGLFQYFTKK